MKVIGLTDKHAGKIKVYLGGWSDQRFIDLEGTPPPKNVLLCLTLEDLKYQAGVNYWDDRMTKAVRAWLTERKHTAIPAELWRKATLDDWLESANAEVWQHNVGQLYSLEDANTFWQAHQTDLSEELKRAVQGRTDAERERILKRVEKRLRRLSILAGLVGSIAMLAQNKLLNRLDRARVKAAREQARESRGDTRLTPDEWAVVFTKISQPEIISQAAGWAADDLIAEAADSEALLSGLQTLGKIRKFRDIVNYNWTFWQKFNGKLDLAATETGVTVDITQAREQPVQMSFDLLKAKRIGPIVPGRTALVVSNDRGLPEIYIRGERKLKFAAQKASGGKIRRFGCTLTIKQDKKLENFLLDIERIDTLAQLDPLSMLPTDADDTLRAVAEAARTDWKQARVLADLLIERQTGVDAEILRRHARNQGRANRR